MKSLQKFLKTLRGSLLSKPNDASVSPDETLTRWLYNKRHFNVSPTRRVKEAGFMPPDATQGLSVFRIEGLKDDEIWLLEQSTNTGRLVSLKGRGDIKAVVVKAPLTVVPDNVPERHATLSGWPTDYSARLGLAKDLAKVAELHRIND